MGRNGYPVRAEILEDLSLTEPVYVDEKKWLDFLEGELFFVEKCQQAYNPTRKRSAARPVGEPPHRLHEFTLLLHPLNVA